MAEIHFSYLKWKILTGKTRIQNQLIFILHNNIQVCYRKNKGQALKTGSKGVAVGLVVLQV